MAEPDTSKPGDSTPAEHSGEVQKTPVDDEEHQQKEQKVATPGAPAAASGEKKKKKKKKKKSAAAPAASPTAAAAAAPTQASAPAPAPAPVAAAGEFKYGDEPKEAVGKLYQKFPAGQAMAYHQDFNAWRTTKAEAREREKISEDMYEQFREAAEAHRRTRMYARQMIKPGMKMLDIARNIERALRTAVGADGLERGIAFPVGLSLNNCAAHFTPNAGDTSVLQSGDVLKVDLGLHVGGRIVDSAFTMCWDPKFQPLLDATRAATDAGVKACGPDVRLCDVGDAIEEVMTSYEVTIGGKTHVVQPVRNLYGHSVGMYQVHAGKSVPIAKGAGDATKLEEGDFLAIETFGSTGHGHVLDDGECSHYMKAFGPPGMVHARAGGAKAKELISFITKNYGTLAFARRWLDEAGISRYALALKALVDCGAVNPYPPLCDVSGSYVAQFEHTVALKPTGKEVFSRGDDY